MDEAVSSLRLLILAGENYRQTAAQILGRGITEAQALSYLATQGDRGQNQIADDLGITSSAATGRWCGSATWERHTFNAATIGSRPRSARSVRTNCRR